jgi:uncharacterized protein YeaO (DUF488 family)
MTVRLKRAYEPPARGDGRRILIDGLWPRGCPRNSLRIDAWPRELAPSDAFRRWFAHDPRRWQESGVLERLVRFIRVGKSA